MQSFVRATGRFMTIAIAALVLTACGSSGRSSARAPADPDPIGVDPPAAIQGVATPSSVSVVTATNAD
jgi:hypothetical protein